MYSFAGNCAVSVPISTFICLWAIYIFPGSVHVFGYSKIDRLILEIFKSLTDIWVEELEYTEHYDNSVLWIRGLHSFISENTYSVSGNQTFILDSHRPFLQCTHTFLIFVYCTVCRNVINTSTCRTSKQMQSYYNCNPVESSSFDLPVQSVIKATIENEACIAMFFTPVFSPTLLTHVIPALASLMILVAS